MKFAWTNLVAAALAVLTIAVRVAEPAEPAAQDALSFVEFVAEDDANCVMREGRMILVHSRHESRPIRVWLERYHLGRPTGDRSRTDLAPRGEAEKLGCSRTDYGAQEWRPVKAQFLAQ